MARKRKRSFGRRSRSNKGFALNMGTLVAAGGYGAVREPISRFVSPLTAKIPFGTIADEAVLLVGNMILAKRVGGMFANVFKTGAIIEASRIGVAFADGTALQMGGSSSNASGPITVVG